MKQGCLSYEFACYVIIQYSTYANVQLVLVKSKFITTIQNNDWQAVK